MLLNDFFCLFLETLRKYPILPMLNRTCVREYVIPGTNQIIEKGVEVYIPVLGIQRDEKYFPEPNRFNPDRWMNDGNITDTGRKVPILTFGDGPRNCIGMRLGKMQAKVGIVLMLQKFKYTLDDCDRQCDLEFDPRHFLLQPRNNIYLHISKR